MEKLIQKTREELMEQYKESKKKLEQNCGKTIDENYIFLFEAYVSLQQEKEKLSNNEQIESAKQAIELLKSFGLEKDDLKEIIKESIKNNQK